MSNYQFSFSQIPPVFKRSSHILIALFDTNRNLWLSRKKIYPSEIYRLFGGGAEANETPFDAANRELKEETGVIAPVSHLKTFEFQINTLPFKLDLFFTQIKNEIIIPNDDVDEVKSFTKSEYANLLKRYSTLTEVNESFHWADWGKVFLIPHQCVLDHWPN